MGQVLVPGSVHTLAGLFQAQAATAKGCGPQKHPHSPRSLEQKLSLGTILVAEKEARKGQIGFSAEEFRRKQTTQMCPMGTRVSASQHLSFRAPRPADQPLAKINLLNGGSGAAGLG